MKKKRIIRRFTQFELNAIEAYSILNDDTGLDMKPLLSYTLVLERQGRMTIAVVLDTSRTPYGFADFIGSGASVRNKSDKEDTKKGELLAIIRAVFDHGDETYPY